MKRINKVAVLGAGTMGARIAAHFANAGVPSLLLDIVPPDSDGPARNKIAAAGLEATRKSKPAAFFEPSLARLVTVGNFEDDLKRLADVDWIIEAVVENLKGQPMILRPEGGPENHWISFQLEGVKSNRLALNARVRATAGDLVQLGEVISGGSYLSQNDLRIHFGLGDHPRVDKAVVTWPDGKVETLTNLVADRFYSLREGSGVVSSNPPESGKAKQP